MEPKKCPGCAAEFVFHTCPLHEAAPSLYEALEALLNPWTDYKDDVLAHHMNTSAQVIRKARAALALARGEAS